MGLLKSKHGIVSDIGAFQDQALKMPMPVQHLNRDVGDLGAFKIEHLAILQTLEVSKVGISEAFIAGFDDSAVFEVAVVVLPVHRSSNRQNSVPERFLVPSKSCLWITTKLSALDDHADVKQRGANGK